MKLATLMALIALSLGGLALILIVMRLRARLRRPGPAARRPAPPATPPRPAAPAPAPIEPGVFSGSGTNRLKLEWCYDCEENVAKFNCARCKRELCKVCGHKDEARGRVLCAECVSALEDAGEVFQIGESGIIPRPVTPPTVGVPGEPDATSE